MSKDLWEVNRASPKATNGFLNVKRLPWIGLIRLFSLILKVFFPAVSVDICLSYIYVYIHEIYVFVYMKYKHIYLYTWNIPRWLSGKESVCQCRRHRRRGFDPWVGKIPWRRKWQPTPGFLPGESHGQRSLVGYSPQRCKELDMIEATKYSTAHIYTHIYVIAQSWKNKNKPENFSEILEVNIYSYPRIAECKMELKPSVLII